MKTFEYRLYLKKEQARLLMACLAESRQIYNSMLEMVKLQYEDKQTFPSKYDLEHAFKGQGSEHVPATTVQMLADRLTKSLKRFLIAKQHDPLVLASLGSSSRIAGTLSNCGNTGRIAICIRIRSI